MRFFDDSYAPAIVVLIIVAGCLLLVPFMGCVSIPEHPSGQGWHCWVENAARINEIEICERKSCRGVAGKFVECPE